MDYGNSEITKMEYLCSLGNESRCFIKVAIYVMIYKSSFSDIVVFFF